MRIPAPVGGFKLLELNLDRQGLSGWHIEAMAMPILWGTFIIFIWCRLQVPILNSITMNLQVRRIQ